MDPKQAHPGIRSCQIFQVAVFCPAGNARGEQIKSALPTKWLNVVVPGDLKSLHRQKPYPSTVDQRRRRPRNSRSGDRGRRRRFCPSRRGRWCHSCRASPPPPFPGNCPTAAPWCLLMRMLKESVLLIPIRFEFVLYYTIIDCLWGVYWVYTCHIV